MVKHLEDDSLESVKKYLEESFRELNKVQEEVKPEAAKLSQSLEDHDGEFLAQYKAAKEFLEEMLKELDAAIDQGRQISGLDLLISQLYLAARGINDNKKVESVDLTESFMDKVKQLYKASEGSKFFKGLLPVLASLGAEAISPALGKTVQGTIKAFRGH